MSSELRKFAGRFSRDWRLHANSFYIIAYDYIQKLPADRKEVLANEYRLFLYRNDADSDEALLELWLEQGAEVWDADINVRPTLKDFYWMMRPDAPEFGTRDNQPVGKGTVVVELVRKHPKR
jgi:hypothetical protein